VNESVKCRTCGTITTSARCPNCGERTGGCQPFEQWPEVMTPADLISYAGFSQHEAYAIFSRKDFPLVSNVARGKKVGKYALREYLNRGATV